MTARSLALWLIALLALSFALGFAAPVVHGLLMQHTLNDLYVPLLGLPIAVYGLYRVRKEHWFSQLLLIFALLIGAPMSSCLAFGALQRSPLQPLTYGTRAFDAKAWQQRPGGDGKNVERSQMTAHLLLGGLLLGTDRSTVRAQLGAPDCLYSDGSGDAWYLGFASTMMDPDCLHVWYTNGRASQATVLQH